MAAVRPSNESIYLLACYQLALADEDPGSCQPVSEAGMVEFPKSFRIAMMQGYVAGILLDNDDEATRWFTLAQNIAGSPPLAAKMAELYASKKTLDATTFSESVAFFDDLPGGTGFKEMLQDEAQEALSRGGEGSVAEEDEADPEVKELDTPSETPTGTAAAADETGPNEEPSDGAQ